MKQKKPAKDDSELVALEARLKAAAREINTVLEEAQKRWPIEGHVWDAVFPDGYLCLTRLQASEEDAGDFPS